jgi:hypothetical protein
MAATIPASCSHDDGSEPEPTPVPTPVIDVTPPTITVSLSSVDITGVEKIVISGNELYVGDKLAASWRDDMTKSCKVQVVFDGNAVSSGDVATHT